MFADLGGIDTILKDILELVQWPLMHPEASQPSHCKEFLTCIRFSIGQILRDRD